MSQFYQDKYLDRGEIKQPDKAPERINNLKALILEEKKLVCKGKDASNLVNITDDFELDFELPLKEYTADIFEIQLLANVIEGNFSDAYRLIVRKK